MTGWQRIYNEWKAANAELQGMFGNDAERDARLDLLRYQRQELESLGLDTEDIRNIDEEHARQANAGRLLESSRQGLERLDADEGPSASSLLNQTLDELSELATLDSGLEETVQLLGEAAVLIKEGTDSLRQYAERLDIDPQRLQWLEQRIGILHDLARKHRCNPEDLPVIEADIRKELDSIEHADEHREALQARLASAAAGLPGLCQAVNRKTYPHRKGIRQGNYRRHADARHGRRCVLRARQSPCRKGL